VREKKREYTGKKRYFASQQHGKNREEGEGVVGK
jgi:hypothetical protein